MINFFIFLLIFLGKVEVFDVNDSLLEIDSLGENSFWVGLFLGVFCILLIIFFILVLCVFLCLM